MKQSPMPNNITILDGIYANPGDLSWEPVASLGELKVYDRTAPDDVIERSRDANILIVNKVKLSEEHFKALPNLKLVVISATGMDHVDLKAAKAAGVLVKNVVGYSTQSVAQHTFALILQLTNQVQKHHEAVTNGEWNDAVGFSFTRTTVLQLSGRTLGIYGLGQIGQEVAKIGQAFGLHIAVTSSHATREMYPDYQLLSLEDLFKKADIISLHTPLKPENKGIVDAKLLKLMKSEAIIVNTARGGLINEHDLADCLKSGGIGGAGLDVLASEPPGNKSPLIGIEQCIITPHMAWTSLSSRKTLIDGVAQHIADFKEAGTQ